MTPSLAVALPSQQPDPESPGLPLRARSRAAPLEPPAFAEMLDLIRARPEELKWASIPWQTDLWEARRLAAAQGKPIFMWSMNGNPLGCV